MRRFSDESAIGAPPVQALEGTFQISVITVAALMP
jgi:hypothetical protein